MCKMKTKKQKKEQGEERKAGPGEKNGEGALLRNGENSKDKSLTGRKYNKDLDPPLLLQALYNVH